jgi:RecQ family ATP-dependent DNA helicase
MQCWRVGFLLEHGREPLESDVASRPRVAALGQEIARAKRVSDLVPLQLQLEHHAKPKENAPLAAQAATAHETRKPSFNVFDLRGRYGAAVGQTMLQQPQQPVALPSALVRHQMTAEQAVAALAPLDETSRAVAVQLCGAEREKWHTAADLARWEPSVLARALEELVTARLVERTSGARVRCALEEGAAEAVVEWAREQERLLEADVMELEEEEERQSGHSNAWCVEEEEGDEEDEEDEEESFARVAVAGGRFRGSAAGTLLAAKERNESGKRVLFDPDAPTFAIPEAPKDDDESRPAPPKRPNPNKPDHNFRKMKLSGQKNNFRRAGSGKWGNATNNFVRPGLVGGRVASDLPDAAEQEGAVTGPSEAVLFDPGAAVRELGALKEFEAAQSERLTRVEWSDDPNVDVESLLRQLGHAEWKAGQEEVCRSIIAGRSVLALMPTGGGKSLCYLLPTLAYPGTLTLVVSPLVSLMRDQLARLPPGLGGAMLTSHQTAKELRNELARVASGTARVLFVAPERVVQPSFAAVLRRLPPVRLVCVDECHCLSQWSHCFRTSYLLLREYLLEPLQPRCVLALTATAVPKACSQVKEALGIEAVVTASLLRPNLALQTVMDPPDPHAALKKLLTTPPLLEMRADGGRVIVYVSLQREAEQLAAYLVMEGIAAVGYHAGMDSQRRRSTEETFRSGKTPIVVATVAFGMGIDVSNVRAIVHFEMPKSVENYVQEVGRAGRDGLPAICVCIVARLQLQRLTSLAYSHSVEVLEVRNFLALLRAQGAGVGCVPMDGPMAREVAATLLAWLHQDGLLQCLADGHGRFLIRWFASGDQGSAVLKWAMQNGAKKKKDGAEWTAVRVCQCARELGTEVSNVHAELEQLAKQKTIGYRLEERSFFVCLTTTMAEWSDETLTAKAIAMHARLAEMEQLNVQKCHDLYNILALGQDAEIKAQLEHYFVTGCATANVPNVAASAFKDAAKDPYVRGDVVTLLKRQSFKTGKEVARVLHGIRATSGDADDPMTASPFWNKARHVEYRSLVRLANELIVAERRNAAERGE